MRGAAMELVEMGGVEPPSRTFSRRYPTSLAGALIYRCERPPAGYRTRSQMIFERGYPALHPPAPRLCVAQHRTRRGEVRVDVAT